MKIWPDFLKIFSIFSIQNSRVLKLLKLNPGFPVNRHLNRFWLVSRLFLQVTRSNFFQGLTVMTSLGAFDFFGIREGCFHQCEAGNKTLHKYLQKLFSFSLNRHVKPVRLNKLVAYWKWHKEKFHRDKYMDDWMGQGCLCLTRHCNH